MTWMRYLQIKQRKLIKFTKKKCGLHDRPFIGYT